jgi:hypothetical protein
MEIGDSILSPGSNPYKIRVPTFRAFSGRQSKIGLRKFSTLKKDLAMTTQWSKVNSNEAGVARYKATNRKAQAWIERNPDGSAEYGAKNGLFGLGLHSEGYHVAPAPSDEVLLGKLDHSANPPRFDNWSKQDEKTPGTNNYEGQADNFFNSTVKASITRGRHQGQGRPVRHRDRRTLLRTRAVGCRDPQENLSASLSAEIREFASTAA